MKKLVPFAACLLLGAVLFGCGKKPAAPEQPKPATADGPTVTIRNDLAEADVWLIPDTEANRKTTLWGTATAGKLALNATQDVALDALGGPGAYLLRAIGTDHMYYEANGLALAAGSTVRLCPGEGPGSVRVEVTDAAGKTEAIDGFAGRL